MNSTDYCHSIVLLFLFLILVKIQCKGDGDWYADRHRRTNGKGLTITSGPEKGMPVTVSNCGTTTVSRRIVGGMTAKMGQFPWIALILGSAKPFCGGVILNERWILTAAHCFKERKSIKKITIKVGMINNDEGALYEVEKLVKHQNYNNDKMEISDLALLKTTQPIQMEKTKGQKTINGICLPDKLQEPQSDSLIVSGWGRTSENGDTSRDLRVVNLDIISLKECQKKFKVPMVGYPEGYTIYKSQICTFTKNKDACQGDSGGPAIQTVNGKAYLVGVVSFGVGCATDFPGVYTKVSHYLDWIAQNMD